MKKRSAFYIRIVLAENHELMRKTIRLLLERNTHWEVVGEAETGSQAITCVRDLNPDILVIDASMPDINTPDTVRTVLALSQDIRVVALSMHSNIGYQRELLESGATAFLLKDRAFEELSTVIKTVVSNAQGTKRVI
jgi:DNA-binding NarL/FixJ family response regulator